VIKLVLVIGMCASAALAQDQPSSTPPKDYSVDCSKFSLSPGCKSFTELVDSKDKDILDRLVGDSFVCFRPDEDVFLIASYLKPDESAYLRTGKYTSEQTGIFFYNRFKEGLTDDYETAYGTWTKNTVAGEDVRFSAKPPYSALIDAGEVSFSYQYKNMRGTNTSYLLQIRKSTKRFVETFDADDLPVSDKNKSATQKPAGASRYENTGYCAEFN